MTEEQWFAATATALEMIGFALLVCSFGLVAIGTGLHRIASRMRPDE